MFVNKNRTLPHPLSQFGKLLPTHASTLNPTPLLLSQPRHLLRPPLSPSRPQKSHNTPETPPTKQTPSPAARVAQSWVLVAGLFRLWFEVEVRARIRADRQSVVVSPPEWTCAAAEYRVYSVLRIGAGGGEGGPLGGIVFCCAILMMCMCLQFLDCPFHACLLGLDNFQSRLYLGKGIVALRLKINKY